MAVQACRHLVTCKLHQSLTAQPHFMVVVVVIVVVVVVGVVIVLAVIL